MQLTDVEKAYLAGLVDADGCIVITKSGKYHQLRIHITQVSEEFLCYWQRIVSLGKVYVMNKGSSKHNKSYQWVICAAKAETFLRSIVDFLVLKRRQADIALLFRGKVLPRGGMGYKYKIPSNLLAHREECRQAIMRLNGRKVKTMSPTTPECKVAAGQ